MTTLAELIAADPDPSFGKEFPEINYGSGTWRIAFMVANPRAGASVTWHDLTGPVSSLTWARGATQARGRFRAVEPTVLINATDDTYAPWNPDTSSIFGVHVPLRAGLLMRASVFRVANDAVDLCFHLFTARVRRWRDQQAANGGYRFHRVDGIDLMSYLVQAPAGANTSEGWKQRIDDVLSDADWPFGSDIYGVQTSDGTTVLQLPERDAQSSAIVEIDATLDPVGLTWRTTPAGKFLAHPWPWDSFHADLFAGTSTIVGTGYTPPIETYYPDGPTLSYNAADTEVQFITEPGGASFGVDSDIENVANEWTITHPVDVTNLASGYTVSAYDDAVSAGYFGRRAIPAATWLAENDTVMEDMVDGFAYTDLTAAPVAIDIRHENVFPAIAVLDHLDPCEIRHASRPGRTELTVSGPLRQISHEIRVWGPNILWNADVQVDIDSEATSTPLNPVQNLAVNTPVPEDYAEFTWTNPSQTTTPTETQVRIPGLSTTWLPLAYPGTGAAGFDWLGLPPGTLLEFEVRLARRVNDIITAVSPARSVWFTTAPATVPVHDGGGTVTIPPYECDVEMILEESTDGGATWSTVETGDESDLDENNVWDLTAYSFTYGYLYRVSSRCEGSGDPWDAGEPFSPECDTPGALSAAPYNDASLAVFVPQICDDAIKEYVSGELGTRGPAFGTFTVDSAGEYALASDSTTGGIVAYGATTTAGLTGDASHAITVSLGEVPANGSPIALWQCAGLHIEAVYESSTTWRVRAKIFIASGGSITTTASDPLSLDTEYEILVAHDVENETVTVDVDGTQVGTGVAGARVNALPVWIMALPADSYATSAAVWSSVIEVGGGSSFFGLIEMLREFWAEDPDWTYGMGVGARDNGTLGHNLGTGPGFGSTAIGGSKPGWTFNGTSQYMRTVSGTSGTTFTVFTVAELASLGVNRTFTDAGVSTNNAYTGVFAASTWRAYNNSGSVNVSGGTADTDPHLMMVVFEDNNTRIYVDGVLIATDSTCTIAAATGITVGTNYASSGPWMSGAIGYVGMYSGDLTDDADYTEWRDAVMAHYGIS